MSILAHLVTSMGEPGATQALTYILNQQPGIVRAFVNLLDGADIRFNPRFRIESEKGDDSGRISGRPDMKICDDDGRTRVLIENKFWAGLMDSQPVDYLKMLPDDVSSGLLFIVPGKRVEMIWKELKTRCLEAGLDLGQDSPKEGWVRWVQVGTRTMLVTDWQNVLDTLERAADGPEIQGDVLQFRRLVETLEDAQAFPALRSDEVTNADAARRLNDYIQLIVDICDRLHGAGIMTYARNTASFGARYFCGRLRWDNDQGYLKRDDEQGREDDAFLTLSFPAWRESGGVTPLWLWMNQAVQHYGDVDVHQFDALLGVTPSDKFIPIRLKLGVERERVIEDAVEQIRAAVFGG